MAQTVLPFQYQAEKLGQTTAFGGLPLYFELAVLSGVIASIAKHLRVRQAGWDDIASVVAIVLLNLAGGEHVEDINRLEQDAGVRRIMVRAMYAHLPRRQRRQREREWFKAEKRGAQEGVSIDVFGVPVSGALSRSGKGASMGGGIG